MAALKLESLAATARLGRIIASEAQTHVMPPILLRGGLGSGKTRLACEITRHLPGGASAEVSSPSFTICNIYSTLPPVLHCDLYRCRQNVPDELWDFLDAGEGMLIVEWAEYLQPGPREYLDIFLNVVKDTRLANVHGHGPAGIKLENRIEELWRSPDDAPPGGSQHIGI